MAAFAFENFVEVAETYGTVIFQFINFFFCCNYICVSDLLRCHIRLHTDIRLKDGSCRQFFYFISVLKTNLSCTDWLDSYWVRFWVHSGLTWLNFIILGDVIRVLLWLLWHATAKNLFKNWSLLLFISTHFSIIKQFY